MEDEEIQQPNKYDRDYHKEYYKKNKDKLREIYIKKKEKKLLEKSQAFKAFLQQDVEKEWTSFLKNYKKNV